MYAVVKTGGKQYRVENEQNFLVDRLKAEEGSIVTLDNLLMVVDSGKISMGSEIEKMAVSATVIRQTRGPKIITLKHRRRKNSRRVKGHRQDLTLLKVLGIGDPAKLVVKVSKPKVVKVVEKKSKEETKSESKSSIKSSDVKSSGENLKKITSPKSPSKTVKPKEKIEKKTTTKTNVKKKDK